MSYVPLSFLDLALAAALVLVNAAVSLAFSLRMERTLALSAIRMVVQLALVALVLRWIFAQTSLPLTLLLACVMVAAAGWEALSRQHRRIAGWQVYGLGTSTLFVVGLMATMFAVAGVIRPQPWYAPQYVLPLLGMVLGNAVTGMALTLDQMTSAAFRDRGAIEARLALGAPPLHRHAGRVA